MVTRSIPFDIEGVRGVEILEIIIQLLLSLS